MNGRVPVHDACFTEKLTSPDVTIIEILESAEMQRRAKDRVKAMHSNLSPTEVKIRAVHDMEPTIFSVFATSEEPKYNKIFLDALLDEFVIFQQQIYDQKHPENGIIGVSSSAIMERASGAYLDNDGRYPIWKLWTDAPPSRP